MRRVVVFDESLASSATVMTDLASLISSEKGSQTSALIRAGRELAGNRPLAELFPFILDLSLQAVSARRGVLMTLEDGELVVKANRGEGFRISSVVRDRVLNSGKSVLVDDTSTDEGLRDRRSIVEQNIRALIAVPLQTNDAITGVVYVDSPIHIREARGFTEDDLNLLTVMANVAAIRMVEHTRLGRDRTGEADHGASAIWSRPAPSSGSFFRPKRRYATGSTWPVTTRPAARWAATTSTSFPYRRVPRRTRAGRCIRARVCPHRC